MAVFSFDATKVEPLNSSFSPLPAGVYDVVITGSAIEQNRSGTGLKLSLELTVQSGEFKGRKIFETLNIQHQNQVAQEIAQRTLSTICHIFGIQQLEDTQQLHGKPLQAKVTIRKDDRYGDRNEIKGYSSSPNAQAAGHDQQFFGMPNNSNQYAAQKPPTQQFAQPAPQQKYKAQADVPPWQQ